VVIEGPNNQLFNLNNIVRIQDLENYFKLGYYHLKEDRITKHWFGLVTRVKKAGYYCKDFMYETAIPATREEALYNDRTIDIWWPNRDWPYELEFSSKEEKLAFIEAFKQCKEGCRYEKQA
jgi:hypothetical protein